MGSPGAAFLACTLAGPLIALPWALLCACLWFHPQRGKLQPQNRLFSRLPLVLQTGLRWYAVLFLGGFIVASIIVMPVLSMSWLS